MLPVLGVEPSDRALDPLRSGIWFTQLRVERGDVDVENCGSAAVVGCLRMTVRLQERLQGRPVLVEGELASTYIAQCARYLARHLGFDGDRPRSVKSLKRFLITPGLEEPGAFAQKCPAHRCFVTGCQGLRPGPRSGFRADEREYEQATSQNFGCFHWAPPPNENCRENLWWKTPIVR